MRRWKHSAEKKGKKKSDFCSFWHQLLPIPNFFLVVVSTPGLRTNSNLLSPGESRSENNAHGDAAREIVVLYFAGIFLYFIFLHEKLCTAIIERVYPQNFASPPRLCCLLFSSEIKRLAQIFDAWRACAARKQIFNESN